MPSLREIASLRQVLADLSRQSSIELKQVWSSTSRLAPRRAEGDLIEAFPELVTPYSSAAGEIASVWYNDLAPDLDFLAEPADPFPTQQLQASARWATGPIFTDRPGVLSRLAKSAGRYIFNGARNTLVENADLEGTTWARHALATTCDFCKVAYLSEEAATGFHDDCHCLPVPVRRGDTYTPPPYVAGWEDEYLAARSASDGTLQGVLAAMRANRTQT